MAELMRKSNSGGSMTDLNNKKMQKMIKLRLEQETDHDDGDPYVHRYGFGLLAYRNTLFILFVAFSLLSLLAYPL